MPLFYFVMPRLVEGNMPRMIVEFANAGGVRLGAAEAPLFLNETAREAAVRDGDIGGGDSVAGRQRRKPAVSMRIGCGGG